MNQINSQSMASNCIDRHGKNIFAVVLLLSVSALWQPAHAWERESSDGGVALFSRAVPGSDLDGLRAEIVVNAGLSTVLTVLRRIQEFPRFMPGMVRSEILESYEDTASSTSSLTYQRLTFRLLEDRDVVLKSSLRPLDSTGLRGWRIDFWSVTGKGPPSPSGVIRIKHLRGGWTLIPLDGGESTRVVYQRHIDLGGSVPDWLVNRGARKSMRKTLLNLNAYCQEANRKLH